MTIVGENIANNCKKKLKYLIFVYIIELILPDQKYLFSLQDKKQVKMNKLIDKFVIQFFKYFSFLRSSSKKSTEL